MFKRVCWWKLMYRKVGLMRPQGFSSSVTLLYREEGDPYFLQFSLTTFVSFSASQNSLRMLPFSRKLEFVHFCKISFSLWSLYGTKPSTLLIVLKSNIVGPCATSKTYPSPSVQTIQSYGLRNHNHYREEHFEYLWSTLFWE